jgi:hypothetical protein
MVLRSRRILNHARLSAASASSCEEGLRPLSDDARILQELAEVAEFAERGYWKEGGE